MQKNGQNDGLNSGAAKTAGNNQWTSGHLRAESDKRERRDGPGGEDGAAGQKENRPVSQQ